MHLSNDLVNNAHPSIVWGAYSSQDPIVNRFHKTGNMKCLKREYKEGRVNNLSDYQYTYKTLVVLLACLRPCVRILDTEWLL